MLDHYKSFFEKVKQYRSFFKENISSKQALEIFGVTSVPSQDELKDIYKKLAIKNHPDKGGSVEQMKLINQAYDILKTMKTSSSSPRFDWAEINAKWKAKNEMHFERIEKIFAESYNEKAVLDYLQQFTSDSLSITTQPPDKKQISKNTWESAIFYTYATITVHNADKTTYFVLQYSFRPASIHNTGLGSDTVDETDIMYDIDVTTSVYHNHKKYKMGQRDYQWKKGKKALVDIELVFPKAKLQKVFSGAKKGIFKKADMLLGMKRELDAKIYDDQIYIYPFGGKDEMRGQPYLVVTRSVILKTAWYQIYTYYALSPETTKYHPFKLYDPYTISFLETEQSLERLVKAVNEFKKQVKVKGFETERPMKDSPAMAKLLSDILHDTFPKDFTK